MGVLNMGFGPDPSPASGGDKVKVTAADTTENYLDNKLTVGATVTKTTVNPGANENIRLDVVATGGLDTDAIHDNVASEIHAITDVAPDALDEIVIEDESDSWNKKRTQLGDIVALGPATHHTSHENGGGDEISVAGLSGVLADRQNAVAEDGIDTSAIHDDTAGEIHAITDVAPLADDEVVFEDESDSWNKKRCQMSDIAGLGDPKAHATSHKLGGADIIALDELGLPTDNTNLNTDNSAHGLCPKLSLVGTEYLSGLGTWTTPPGSGDADAIHDNVAGEIHAITDVAPAATDEMVIEDADDSWNKKRTQLSDIAALGDPKAHHTSHENGGADEISVAGLSGVLADNQYADELRDSDGDTIASTGDDRLDIGDTTHHYPVRTYPGIGNEYFFTDTISEEITVGIGTDSTTSTTNLFPANSVIRMIGATVSQSCTGASTWSLLPADGTGDELIKDISVALWSKGTSMGDGDGTHDGPWFNKTAAKINIDTDANVTDTDFKVRITVLYDTYVGADS